MYTRVLEPKPFQRKKKKDTHKPEKKDGRRDLALSCHELITKSKREPNENEAKDCESKLE
jgi:hypothetical protein